MNYNDPEFEKTFHEFTGDEMTPLQYMEYFDLTPEIINSFLNPLLEGGIKGTVKSLEITITREGYEFDGDYTSFVGEPKYQLATALIVTLAEYGITSLILEVI